jgi:hypothetical protein
MTENRLTVSGTPFLAKASAKEIKSSCDKS